MKKFGKILVYLLGFPLMFGLIFWESWSLLQNNWTYGIWNWSGIAVAALVLIVFTVIVIITGKISKKTNRRQVVRRCTGAMVLASVILTAGIWGAIDIFVPDILSSATSGTIKATDLIENYEAKSEEHAGYLTSFIEMNVANGNLSSYTEEEYLSMGYGCQEVRDLIDQQYYSQHKVGYTIIGDNGPWLNLADSDRMTIAAVIHLVINEREYILENADGEEYDIRELYPIMLDGEDVAVQWTIMDMTNPVLIDLSSLLGSMGDLITSLDPLLSSFGGVEGLTETLTEVIYGAVEDEAVAGSGIYILIDLDAEVDEDGSEFVGVIIQNVTEDRGVFDYMHTAWFQSNNLLVAVINLYALRHIMYFFAGIVAILSLIIGFIREKQYKDNFTDVEDEDSSDEEDFGDEATKADAKTGIAYPQTPYMDRVVEAQAQWATRNTYVPK